MTTALILIALYGAYGTFCIRFLLHARQWLEGVCSSTVPGVGRKSGPATLACAAADLLLFTRLLRTNGALWIGEWIFHVSLVLVLLRHLRYMLEPVPAWVWALQPWGLAAGYLLPFALAYILTIRIATTQELYSSRRNLVLLAALFLIGLSGVLMHALRKPDLVGIKAFMMGMVTFSPAPWPGGLLLTLHVILAIAIVPILPTHIFIAPVTIMEARMRDDGLHGVLHGR